MYNLPSLFILLLCLKLSQLLGAKIDPCQRQPFSATCPGDPGSQDVRSQFVLRYYKRGNECVSYPYGHCRKVVEEVELYKYKEDCEEHCVSKSSHVIAGPGSFVNKRPSTPTPDVKKSDESSAAPSTVRAPGKPRLFTRRPSLLKTDSTTAAASEVTTRIAVTSTTSALRTFSGQRTKCQQAREEAQLKNANLLPASPNFTLVPVCTLDGEYDDVQCDARLRVCWCTEEDGSEIPGSRTKGDYSSPPNCSGEEIVPTAPIINLVNIPSFFGTQPSVSVETAVVGATSTEPTPMEVGNLPKTLATSSVCGKNSEPLGDVNGGVLNCLLKPCPNSYRCVPNGVISVCCEKEDSEFSALTNEESQIDVCNLPKERGDCGKYQLRFYYDQKLGECKYFFYSGCRGNGNNFKGLAECQRTCRYVSSSSPAVAKTERANLFTDISESKSTIKSSPVAETARAGVFESVTLLPNPDTVRSDVSASNSLNGFTSLQRSETSVLPALTARPLSTDQRVDSGAAPPAFGSPGVGSPGNLFSTDSTVSNKESFKPQLLAPEAKSQEPGKNSFPSNRCDQPKDKGPCSGAFIRWYWNPASADCELFTYGGCQGNGNNFDTKEECVSTCKDVSPDVCSHPEDVGDCGSAISRWRYDSTVHLCQPFIYSGCGGNGNNFASHAECRARCERVCIKLNVSSCLDPCVVVTRLSDCQECACPRKFNDTNQLDNTKYDTAILTAPREEIASLKPIQTVNTFKGLPANVTNEPVTSTATPVNEGTTKAHEQSLRNAIASLSVEEPTTQTLPANSAAVNQINATSSVSAQPVSATAIGSPGDAKSPQILADKCMQPLDPGPCNGPPQQRFWFNGKSHQCEQFQYGGCAGNNNHFYSLQECEIHCARFFAGGVTAESFDQKQGTPSSGTSLPHAPEILAPQPVGSSVLPVESIGGVAPAKGQQLLPPDSYAGGAGSWQTAPSPNAIAASSSPASISQPVSNQGSIPTVQVLQPGPSPSVALQPAAGAYPAPSQPETTQQPITQPPQPYPQPTQQPVVQTTGAIYPKPPPTQGTLPPPPPTQLPVSPSPSPPIIPTQGPVYPPVTQPPIVYPTQGPVYPTPPPYYPSPPVPQEPQIPLCPNNEPPMLHPDNRPILCLPGKDQCPPMSSCFFNGLDYACCPATDDPYEKKPGYPQPGPDDVDPASFGGSGAAYGQQQPGCAQGQCRQGGGYGQGQGDGSYSQQQNGQQGYGQQTGNQVGAVGGGQFQQSGGPYGQQFGQAQIGSGSSQQQYGSQQLATGGGAYGTGPRFQNIVLAPDVPYPGDGAVLGTPTATAYSAVPHKWKALSNSEPVSQAVDQPGATTAVATRNDVYPMGENAPPSNLTSVDQSGHNALYLDLKEQAGCYDIPDSGPCRGSHLRWYYDRSADQCRLFYYGGCKGNRNNHETQGACQQKCHPSTSGFCPDNTLPLGGQYPLICGDSKDSVTCPDGYICVPGIVQVCCLRPTTYKVDESVPEKYRAKAPKFSPRAPGVAPYLAQPQSNALSFADIRILRAQYERMAAERDGEKAMFKKPSRVDVGKSQKFVVSSAVAPSNNASVEIDKTSVQLVENPYNNGENSQSTDNSDNTYLLRPPPPNAGNLTNTVEELEPVALNPNFFNRPLSPTSFLACPDGAEPLKDARTGKPQDCILDSNNNPLCARGQYCHIDLESKTRFCCDISSRAGFGEVSSNNKDNESQPAHKRVLGASACLGGRCRPISQSWFHGSDSAEQTTSATPETVTLPNTKRETKDEINPYTTNSSSQDGNADYKRVIYTGYAPARNTFGLASSILRIPDKAVNTSSLAANNVRQHDDGTFDLKPSSYDKRCYLPPNQGLECPNAENTKLSTNVFYYFIVEEQRCNLFFYKGCQGNENRFSSREKCLQACGRGLSAAEKL